MRRIVDWFMDKALLIAMIGLVLTALATVLGWCSRWWLLAELASHFRVQYFWIGLLGTLLFAVARRFRWAGLGVTVALVNLALIAPLYRAPPHPDMAGRPTSRAVSLNVYTSNRQPKVVERYLRSTGADYVVLLEISSRWREVLDALSDIYPHQLRELHEDNFGIVLLSKRQWTDARVVWAGGHEIPSVLAHFNQQGQQLALIGTHPMPPGTNIHWQMRNDQLQAIGELARSETGPVLLMGDLNITSWSAWFNLLTDGTRLRDSRLGFGVQASWPDWATICRIPIDHCLVSPEIIVTERHIGPFVGSDHSPVEVEFVVGSP